MLSGKKPGDGAQAEARGLAVSPDLAGLAERLLDPDPSRRPASSTEVRRALEAFREDATDSPARSELGKAQKTSRFLPALVLVTFVAVASITFLVSRNATRSAASGKALSVSLTEPVIGVGGKSNASASTILPDGKRESGGLTDVALGQLDASPPSTPVAA